MSQHYWMFGTQLNIIADEQKTNGLYDLIEGSLASGLETPLHLHTKYSEELYTLEGEYTVYFPNETMVVKPGEHCFIPMNTPHVIAATGPGISRGLTIASPSGFAELIRNVGTVDDGTGAPEQDVTVFERFMAISEKLGDVLLGPPGARP